MASDCLKELERFPVTQVPRRLLGERRGQNPIQLQSEWLTLGHFFMHRGSISDWQNEQTEKKNLF